MLLIVPGRCFCGGSFCFMSWCLKIFRAVGALCVFSCFWLGWGGWVAACWGGGCPFGLRLFRGVGAWLLVWFFPPRFLEWESFSDCAFFFFFFFFFFFLGETSTIGGCFCGFVVPGAPEGSTGRRF